MNLSVRRVLCRAILPLLCTSITHAGESHDWASSTWTGDWNGLRTQLSESGINLEASLKVDAISNVEGGMRNGTRLMDNWDLKLTADLEKLWGWNNSTAYVHVLSNQGSKLNANYVGSFMGVDNIEVATNTTRLFHAWVEHRQFDDRFAMLVGLYPIDSEFYVTDSTGLFMHPSGGMAANLGQTGRNGPSIFPVSSFGTRLKWEPTKHYYVQAAVLDGVPGDPNDPRGTHIQFNDGDGTLAIMETGVRVTESVSKFAIGYWRYTPRFDDLTETDLLGNPVKRANRGVYGLAEQTVYREQGDAGQGLTLFARYGIADDDINRLDYSYSLGLHYIGLLPGRDEDEIGFAMARAHAGDKFRSASELLLSDAETAFEITYRAAIRPWLYIQPTLQHIADPGFDPALQDAWVIGTRFAVTF